MYVRGGNIVCDWSFAVIVLRTTVRDKSFLALLDETGEGGLLFEVVLAVKGKTVRDRFFVAMVLRTTVHD